MSLEEKKKSAAKLKFNEKVGMYLFSKKGSAKEKIYENRIHDVFDEKAKAKAKSKVQEKILKSEVLKNTIGEFNKYNTITKRFPTMNEVKKNMEIKKQSLVKKEEEKIDIAFEKKKRKRNQIAAELAIKEVAERLKSRSLQNKFIPKKDKNQNPKENKKRVA
ncbi:MAG: hypothetical protein QG630_335 [Patescibacteria group bacterium]|nr:hypothetical protein [Patescibacteria group bacterium]